MKRYLLLISAIIASASLGIAARDLVILHTNDTHSLIVPDIDGRGGVLQRKAIIDSVRKAERNVLLIDAGDRVQGSLYFKFFKGEVDYPIQNMMDVDISILGNHEFDNGMEMLAANEKTLKSVRLSTNYDFDGTPAEGLYRPYLIKKIDGKKIGFMGINIDPESIIAESTRVGLKYRDAIVEANKMADFLKNDKKCDLVVAITHIGYGPYEDKASDRKLAAESKHIDVIIGGHSHTVVDPDTPHRTPHIIENAVGRPVLVTQTGKSGKNIGEIRIDLSSLADASPADFSYRLIPVTDRFPAEKLDKKISEFLAPYTQAIDSINNLTIGFATEDLMNGQGVGNFQNWIADFGAWYGNLKLDSLRAFNPSLPRLDFAIMNAGGIRNSIPKGPVSKGQLMSAFPFNNKYVVMEISGKDLIDMFKIASRQGGQPVSREVRVVYGDNRVMKNALIDLKKIDPEKTYLVGTIDYLAWGNDDLRPLANGKWIFTDDVELCAPVIRYVLGLTSLGLPIEADSNPRFVKSVD